MNSGVKTALVIGGGFSGMTAALQLSRQGIAVDLVEIDPGWRSYGAGISLHGSTLRVLRDLGLLERFLEEGYATDGVELRGPDDQVLAVLPTPRVAGPDVPGGAAIMRPALARVLKEAGEKEKVDVLRQGRADGRCRHCPLHRWIAAQLRPRDRRGRSLFTTAPGMLPGGTKAALHRPVSLARRTAHAGGH